MHIYSNTPVKVIYKKTLMYSEKSRCIFLFVFIVIFLLVTSQKKVFKLCTVDTLRWDATHTSSAFKLRTRTRTFPTTPTLSICSVAGGSGGGGWQAFPPQ